jgi:hypothetical protein
MVETFLHNSNCKKFKISHFYLELDHISMKFRIRKVFRKELIVKIKVICDQ